MRGNTFEWSQQFIETDSTATGIRYFTRDALDRLAQDSDLQYPLEMDNGGGWTGYIYQFLTSVYKALVDLLNISAQNFDNILNLFYFISGGVIVYLLYRLFGARYLWIFSKAEAASEIPNTIEEENIHTIDFDQEIKQALGQGQHRLAIRLVYLHTLKILSDRQVIYWHPGRTNREYFQDIQKADLQQPFNTLSYYFNYVWYGNFPATLDTYHAVKQEFDLIHNTLKTR